MAFKLKQYFWLIHLLGILFCSYFVAQFVSVYLVGWLKIEERPVLSTSVAQADTARQSLEQDYQVILDRNIFDSREIQIQIPTTQPSDGGVVVETRMNDQLPRDKPVPTSLPVKLVATVSIGDSLKGSMAIVEVARNKAELYTLGDEKAFSGVKLVKILPDQIWFQNGSRLEFLKIEDFAKSRPSSGSPQGSPPPSGLPGAGETPENPVDGAAGLETENIVVAQVEINKAMEDGPKLIQQIGGAPNMVGGKEMGVRLTRLPPSGLFTQLGLQRGDVIEKINGTEVTFSNLIGFLNLLQNEKNISVELTRGGKKKTIQYQIQ